MARTIMLYGRCLEVRPAGADGGLFVEWKEAFNFVENAGYMISGEFSNAVVIPVNSTHGISDAAAVRVSVDREATNFKGFRAEFWLHDEPYRPEGDPLDFDWVAFIPCAAKLT